MKMMKKMIAIVLVSLMALSFCACHKKDEIAVTVGDVEFTSAYYMCALINADMEAQSLVYEGLSEEEQAAEIDYYSHKVEDTDYVEWVENRALENLKEIAAYKILCKENELTIDEETQSYVEQYTEYYWTSYGYSTLFEPNGVSKTTYTNYSLDATYSSLYFDHLYAEGGEKEITADEMSKAIAESFVLADTISTTFTTDDGTEMTEDEIAALKEQFNGYVTAIQNGTKTYEQVYHEFNGTDEADDTATDTTTEETTEETEEEEETVDPINRHASVLGAEETDYASDDFETVKAMAVGEVKLIEVEDNGGLKIYVKRDLAADTYYVDQIDSSVRHLLKDEEYENTIAEYVKGLEFKVIKYAVNQFKVKKIVYPEAAY